MQPDSDAQLLRSYAERGSEDAFAELVRRYTNLVYSAALRQVDSSDVAAEITQKAFISLARGSLELATRLEANASVSGWLCRSARNLSLNHRRDEFRRHNRERQAMEQLHPTTDDSGDWERLRKVLDDAMAELSEADYDAVVLRYFQKQDFRLVGEALGVSDDTAQKRVARAIEKLRHFLAQKGFITTTVALTVMIGANAIQAAPAGIALSLSAKSLLAGIQTNPSATVAITKTIAMTTLQKTAFSLTIAALGAVGIYQARQATHFREQNELLVQNQATIAEQVLKLQKERDGAANRLASLSQNAINLDNSSELLKLRNEAGRLRRQAQESSKRVHDAEQELNAFKSAQEKFGSHEAATVSAMKHLCLAIAMYSSDNNDQRPTNFLQLTNFVQLTNELGGNSFKIGEIELFSFDLIKTGAERLEQPGRVIEVRERFARQTPDGSWKRVYGFADGSVHVATSINGDFAAWEKANTYQPAQDPQP